MGYLDLVFQRVGNYRHHGAPLLMSGIRFIIRKSLEIKFFHENLALIKYLGMWMGFKLEKNKTEFSGIVYVQCICFPPFYSYCLFLLWTDRINRWIVILTKVSAVYCKLRILELHNIFKWFFSEFTINSICCFFKKSTKTLTRTHAQTIHTKNAF